MSSSDDDFLPAKKNILKTGLQSDDKKKRGRPKGSKNKTSAKSNSKRKSIPLATDVKAVINPGQQVPSTNVLVPKIVLKINVSKGTVKGGDELSSATDIQAHSLDEHEHVMSKFTDDSPTSIKLSLPNVPRTSRTSPHVLPEDGVKRTLFYSSSDDDSSTNENLASKLKRMKARSKLLKSFIPYELKGIPSPASCADSCVSSLGVSDEHAIKAERLQKRFKRVKKSPKKRKKRKPGYYTLKPEILEDNSARSSGSSVSSDDYNAWKRQTMTNPTDIVSKQIDLPDSSPEKGKRQPSPSPPTSPERKTSPKRNTRKDNAGLENMWNVAANLKWAPAKPAAVSQPLDTKIKSQVEEFFRGYSPASSTSSFKPVPVPVRFPVVHEANCCVLWRERSAARGKQPAGRGRRKRKGVCTGYLACPCQNGAGPSTATAVLPSFHMCTSGIRPATHAQPPSMAAATGSSTSMLDEDIIQLAKDALVADSKLRPQKVLAIMDISDDSDVDGGPHKVSARIKSPTPEKETVIKGENPSLPSPKRRDSKASDSSDVEFVPGPPIEEIVVSDDSNDIIFVSETASPNKPSTAANTPKKEGASGLSTESVDIIFDFVSNNTSPHASFLRRKLPVSPLVDSSSNDVLKAEAELVSNPICALPPPENFVTSFDTTLESLYPAYSKNAGRTSEPLDFDALLDFEAETMTTQNYEPYSPCLPDPPHDDYDRGDEIINIGSPERPAPEPIPEKADGLVVWECPVCFEPKGDETILATTDCTHLFCDPCIRKVASMYGKCPVCQCPIKENNIHPFRFHGYKF